MLYMHHKDRKSSDTNRQHIKPTQISAEQYLCEQLHKYTKTDPLENILTQLEKQPAANNINNNMYNMPHRNNTTHEHPSVHKEQDNSERINKENNEHKISVNRTQGSRSIDNEEKGQDSGIRTRYGRIV